MKHGPPLKLVAASLGLAACGALAAALGLAAVSTPDGYLPRLATVERQVALAEKLQRASGPSARPAEPPCEDDPTQTVAKLRQELGSSAQGRGLKPTVIDVRPSNALESGVVPLEVRFEGSGAYDGAVTFLDSLSQRRPGLFVQVLDLEGAAAGPVALAITGKVFCSPSR